MKAFPKQQLQGVTMGYPQDGMDLRDYFAAKALVGLTSDHTNQCNYDEESYEEFANNAAMSAYMFADAMMKAREQK